MTRTTKKLIALLLAVVMIVTIVSPLDFGWSSAAESRGADTTSATDTDAQTDVQADDMVVDEIPAVYGDSTNLDLEEYITNIRFVDSNGNQLDKVPTSPDGTDADTGCDKQAISEVAFNMDFSLTSEVLGKMESGEITSFTYELPASVQLPSNVSTDGFSGFAKAGDVEFGRYSVKKNDAGKLVITLNDFSKDKLDKLKDGGNYKETTPGFVRFDAKLSEDKVDNEGNWKENFTYGDSSEEVSIAVDYTPSVGVVKNNATVTVDTETGTITYDYTLTVNSAYGTQTGIDFTDEITGGTTYGNNISTKPVIDCNSIKVTKGGQAVSWSPTVEDYKITGTLGSLSKGESYTVTYKAVATITDNSVGITADSNAVTNTVKASAGADQGKVTKTASVTDKTAYQGSEYTDLAVTKTAADTTTDADKVTFHYTVKISSTTGTKDGITINDVLQGQGYGARTVKNLKVTSSSGETVDTSGLSANSSITTTSGQTALSGKLADLDAGETYTLEYDVVQTITDNTQSVSIDGTNKITVKDKNNEKSAQTWYTTHTYTGEGAAPGVTKSGSYDKSTSSITWTVSINSSKAASLAGTTISDSYVKNNESATKVEETVSVYANDSELGSFKLPITIGAAADGKCTLTDADKRTGTVGVKDALKFTYTMAVEPPATGTDTYKNTATAKKESSTETGIAEVKVAANAITKTNLTDAQVTNADGTIVDSWTSVIKGVDSIASGTTFTDKFAVTDASNTMRGKFASYMTASQVKGISLSGIDASTYTVKVIVYYWNGGSSYTNINPMSLEDYNTKYNTSSNTEYFIGGFEIAFNNGVTVPTKGITVSYSTTAAFVGSNTGTATYTNTATMGDYSDSADATVKSPRKPLATKKVKDTSGALVENAVFDESADTLIYQVVLNPSKDAEGEITFTDTLPDGLEFTTFTNKDTNNFEYITGSGFEVGVTYVQPWGSSDTGYQKQLGKPYSSAVERGVNASINNNTLTVEVPKDAYSAIYNSGDVSIAIQYAVKLTDEAKNSLDTKGTLTFTNTGTATDKGQTTKASAVAKVEKQKLDKSPVNIGKNDKTSYFDSENRTITYKMTVNPSAEKIGTGDTITVVDTFDYSSLSSMVTAVSVKPGSISVKEVGDSDLSSESYAVKESDENGNKVLQFTLPNSKAVEIEYTYMFTFTDLIKAGEYTFKNSAYIVGQTSDAYKTSDSTKDQVDSSAAGLELESASLILVKTDSIDGLMYLKGAHFKLEKYVSDGDSAKWEDVTGYKDITTNDKGQLELSKIDYNYYYRLSETKAPSGYKLPSGVYNLIYIKKTGESYTEGPVFNPASDSSNTYYTLTLENGYVFVSNDRSDQTITLSKKWVGTPGTAATIDVYRTTSAISQDSDFNANNKVVTITLDSASSWTKNITISSDAEIDNADNLVFKMKDASGNAYYYYFREQAIDGYTTSGESLTGINTTQTVTITNTKDAEPGQLTVTKVWDGDTVDGKADAYNTRPGSITVTLYKDNAATETTAELTANNNWTYTFTGLEADGNYSVKESAVDYYEDTVGAVDGGNVTITNTLKTSTAETEASLNIVKYQTGTTTALSGATYTLYTDAACKKPLTGSGGSDVTATTDSNGKASFTGLKGTGSDAVIYYLKETDAPKGYELDENVYTVTVTPTVKTEKDTTSTSVVTTMTWTATITGGTESGGVYTLYDDKLATLVLTKQIVEAQGNSTKLTDKQKDAITFTVVGKRDDEEVHNSTYKYSDLIGESNGLPSLTLTVACGKYTITETSADVDGYTRKTTVQVGDGEAATADTAAVTLDQNNLSASVVFANTYNEVQKTGALVITKTISGAVTEDEAKGALQFTVTDNNGNAVSGHDNKTVYKLSDTVDGFTYDSATKTYTKTFENVPIGTYRVSESVSSIDGHTLASASYTVTAGDEKSSEKNITEAPNTAVTATVSDSMTTTVAYADDYTKDVSISKTDMTGSSELSGAVIKLTSKTQDVTFTDVTDSKYGCSETSWTSSSTTAHKVSLPAGTYTLEETTAPSGYKKLTSTVTFTVNSDGTITLGTDETTKKYLEKDNNGNLKLKNEAEDKTISISKRDITSGDEVAGATLTIASVTDKDNTATWVSEKTASKKGKVITVGDAWAVDDNGNITIKAGEEYTLTETVAPQGYAKITTTIRFSVSAQGKITISDNGAGAAAVDTSDASILVANDTALIDLYIKKGTMLGDKSIKELDGASMTFYEVSGRGDDEKLTEVESWTSNKTSEPNGHKIAGSKLKNNTTYVLRETVAPNGYTVTTDVRINISESGSVTTPVDGANMTYGGSVGDRQAPIMVLLDDAISDIQISKKTVTGGDELEGASMALYERVGGKDTIVKDSNGSEYSWTSGKAAKTIKGTDLKVGSTYVLKETAAPDGYTVATDITFTIGNDGKVTGVDTASYTSDTNTITMFDDAIKDITISKVELAKAAGETGSSTKELNGAELKLYEGTDTSELGIVVESWTTDTSKDPNGHAISGSKLKTGTTYTLVENAAPEGYKVASNITFKIDDSGEITDVSASAYSKDVEKRIIVMLDNAKGSVTISKKAVNGTDELVGAQLAVYYASGVTNGKPNEGANAIESWTSTSTAKTFILNEGTYVLVETTAPKGYAVAESITFTMDKDGNVKVGAAEADGNVVTMQDKAIEVNVSKTDLEGEEVAGATIKLYKAEDISDDGKVKDSAVALDTWISEAGKKHNFGSVLETGESYVLVETAAPDGYYYSENIAFTVESDGTINVTEKDDNADVDGNNITIKDEAKPGSITFNKIGYYNEKCSEDAGMTKALEGAEFTLYDERGNEVAAAESDKDGKVEFADIANGSYTIRETKAPDGYIIDDTVYSVSIVAGKASAITDADGKTVANNNFVNDIYTTDIRLQKVAEENTGIKLSNSTYGLYRKASKRLVAMATTDKEGVLTFDGVLLDTEYTIVELQSPDGSYVSEKPISIAFTADKDGKVRVASIDLGEDNGKTTATVDEDGNITWLEPSVRYTFNKLDENGKALSGATLVIIDASGNEVAKWVTDGTAYSLDRVLVAGRTYTLRELEAPSGYEIAEDITFTVPSDAVSAGEGKIISVTMTDKLTTTETTTDTETTTQTTTETTTETTTQTTTETTTQVTTSTTTETTTATPKTGDTTPIAVAAMIMLLAVAGAGGVVIYRRRKTR